MVLSDRESRRHRLGPRLGLAFVFLAAAALVGLPACTSTEVAKHADSPPQAAAPAAATNADDAYRQIERLAETIVQIRKNYVEEISSEQLVTGAIKGMLSSLDEHSYYMEPQQFKDLREETSGLYGGVGIMIGFRGGQLTVIAPIEDSPSYRAGVMADDRIVKINGKSTAGISMRDAVSKLKGQPGTKVQISISRASEPAPLDIDLVREFIKVPSVKGARMMRDGVGYIRVTQFSENTAQSLLSELQGLATNGMTSLVLDLRSNPGGLLSAATDVASLFLKEGQLIVSTKGRVNVGHERAIYSSGRCHFADMPMAILINRGSASASEIVAGALKDQGRAVLVGERTFGKGSVQSVLKLKSEENAAIRLTTGKYYTPGNLVIHDHGIEPDIPISVPPDEWQKILTRRAHLETPAIFTDADKAKFESVVDGPLERAADVLRALSAMKARSGGASSGRSAPAAATNAPAEPDPDPAD